jgi:hypothetical protein
MICKTNQAQVWMGCAGPPTICCPTGTECIQDAAGNQYCSPACAATQPCAGSDAGFACCTSVHACDCVPNCSTATYCTPCP